MRQITVLRTKCQSSLWGQQSTILLIAVTLKDSNWNKVVSLFLALIGKRSRLTAAIQTAQRLKLQERLVTFSKRNIIR